MACSYDSIGEGLHDEILSQAADTFFGARREIEELSSVLYTRVNELSEQVDMISSCYALLKDVLITKQAANEAVSAMGLGGIEAVEGQAGEDCGDIVIGRSMTRKGKYKKLVLAVAERLQGIVDAYLFGTYVEDPEQPGKKILTTNLAQSKALCNYINEMIAKVNAENKPSTSISFMKKLDPERLDQEKHTGGTLDGFCCSLDDELSFGEIDFDVFELPEFNPNAFDNTVRKQIGRIAAAVADSHLDEISMILEKMEKRD